MIRSFVSEIESADTALLPLRLVGICVGAVFAFLRAVVFLPARLLGYRSR